jgi:hypothetical protein
VNQIDLFCRVVLGVVFVVAAAGKLRGRGAQRATRVTVRAFGITSGALATVIAVSLPFAELAVAVLLVIPPVAMLGYVLAGGLLIGFSAGVAVALRRGQRVPCRCFGASEAPIGRRHLVRNGGLLAVAVAGLAASIADGAPGGLTVDPAALVAAFAGLLVALLVIRMEDLVFLFRSTRS